MFACGITTSEIRDYLRETENEIWAALDELEKFQKHQNRYLEAVWRK